MTLVGVGQIVLFLLVLLLLVKPLGWYMAQIYEAKPAGLNQVGKPFEFFLYRLCSIKPKQGMDWKQYSSSLKDRSLKTYGCLGTSGKGMKKSRVGL